MPLKWYLIKIEKLYHKVHYVWYLFEINVKCEDFSSFQALICHKPMGLSISRQPIYEMIINVDMMNAYSYLLQAAYIPFSYILCCFCLLFVLVSTFVMNFTRIPYGVYFTINLCFCIRIEICLGRYVKVI